MAAIPVRTFAVLTQNFAAGVQGRAKALVDFSVGAVLRAVAEATADLALWLQSIVVYVLTLTRAATSRGADLDTWFADWFFLRLPARAATGLVTCTRFSANVQLVVPVGFQVQTGDASLVFAVYADTTNPAYSAALGGYVMPAGTLSVDVPVQAQMPLSAINGSAWNVVAGQITQARSSDGVGIDTVTNAAAFITGVDAESDAAFRLRFRPYIASFAKATPTAIQSAVINLQQGLTCQITEVPGIVTVYVDDGSGAMPADVLAGARAAVNAVRAGGVQTVVMPAERLQANIQMIVEVGDGYAPDAVVSAVQSAVSLAVNGLGQANKLRYSRLDQIAYDASPGVTNVTGLLLNGGTGDLIPTAGQTIKVGNLVVDPAT
ncbi:baseplate J/gp47 family protein [Methylobacterium sp. D53M]